MTRGGKRIGAGRPKGSVKYPDRRTITVRLDAATIAALEQHYGLDPTPAVTRAVIERAAEIAASL